MKIGVQIPNNSDKPRQIGLTKMGRLAEDAGADSLWVNDHLLLVEGGRSSYPFTPDGALPWPMDLPWYECLTAASFLAASTSGCRIGTSVLVLPQRNVLELAKTTATLDALSGGRFVLGIGAGWFAEEIEVLRRCWMGRPKPFEGEEIAVPEGLVFEPRPSQPDGPPILVGGMSRAALRRAALRGDGWLAFQREELDTTQLADLLETLENLRGGAGRLEEPFSNVMRLHTSSGMTSRLPEIAHRIQELGFDELIINPTWENLAEAEELIGSVKSVVVTDGPS
jgi:alkanesulfonate monooxygenase SsuD/methylene tetrahydromethanopterin reductase-like flavin-dependent oxidoreductase (luciferase family)